MEPRAQAGTLRPMTIVVALGVLGGFLFDRRDIL
jgi:hypothetical protein